MGTGLAACAPGRRAAVLLADLPSLRPQDLDATLRAVGALLDAAPDARQVVVPDAEGTGTVLLAARRPDEIRHAFGTGSAARHEAARGAPAGVRAGPAAPRRRHPGRPRRGGGAGGRSAHGAYPARDAGHRPPLRRRHPWRRGRHRRRRAARDRPRAAWTAAGCGTCARGSASPARAPTTAWTTCTCTASRTDGGPTAGRAGPSPRSSTRRRRRGPGACPRTARSRGR